MPQKAGSACKRSGCPGIVRNGVCSVCGPTRRRRDQQTDARRGNSRERGYDSRWDRLRAMQLRQKPLCERCQQAGRTTPAELVHHVKPLCDGGELLDQDNLQSLCRKCHGEVHAELDAAKRG